jgi:RNA polymerase sigma factor (sigma-70 family)
LHRLAGAEISGRFRNQPMQNAFSLDRGLETGEQSEGSGYLVFSRCTDSRLAISVFKPKDFPRKREMSPAQLEDARLGFNQLLRKHMSPQWIERHAEDLFAKAALEYSRKLDAGEAIERPAAWIVACAWQRTKSELEAERREPQLVSTEFSGPLASNLDEGPEEATLSSDRARRIQDAVAHLSADQRRLLALAYFEDMSVREAGRQLNWHSSKVQRCHNAARKRLRALLGVESLDELEIIVGLAAYLSLSAEPLPWLHLPPFAEAAALKLSRGAEQAWARLHDLSRRVVSAGGTDPAAAPLGGNIGRAAGACAAGIVCAVGGAIVLGGGGGAPHPHRPIARAHKESRAPLPRLIASAPAAQAPERQSQGPAESGKPPSSAGQSQRASAASAERRYAEKAVQEQIAPESVDRPSQESEPYAAPESSESAASAPAPSSASASSTPSAIANQQFGP